MAESITMSASAGTASEEPRTPTIVVDDLHVTYRIAASTGRGNAPAALLRMIRKAPPPRAGLREVHAVRGVTFTAYRGEAIGLVGRNGSGKSTLLRAIAGLLPPSGGAVFSKGQPSLLGVNAALMNDLSGERNIILGCLAMGMSPEEAQAKLPEVVEFAGVAEEFIPLPMDTYSSGMAARLRFAIASAKEHDVLLVDEALATGDADFRKKSERRIRELRDSAGTVFLVSHQLEVVRTTCQRAIWLEQGSIVMDDDANAVVDAYEAKFK